MDKGEENTHIYSTIKDRKFCFTSLLKTNEKESNSLLDREYDSSIIFLKNGATGNKGLIDLTRGSWNYLLKLGITTTAECLTIFLMWRQTGSYRTPGTNLNGNF